jgi:hypothetical protein
MEAPACYKKKMPHNSHNMNRKKEEMTNSVKLKTLTRNPLAGLFEVEWKGVMFCLSTE